MTMKTYADALDLRRIPQTEPLPTQVENSAGGFSFQVDDWTRLQRFLILGTEGGSYYASERKLTKENAETVIRCVKADGFRAVKAIVEVSDEGRAPKNDPAIFALAIALKMGNEETRRIAVEAVPVVCRIGTHIFQFAQAVKALGGWGRLTKKAVAKWYGDQPADRLAMNLVKYQSRAGWSHRDLLRLGHVKPADAAQGNAFRWAVGKPVAAADMHVLIRSFEQLKEVAAKSSAKEAVAAACVAITAWGLPRECIPTELLNSADVWEALLYGKTDGEQGRGMPIHALVRNLAKMTAVGLLTPNSDAALIVAGRLQDAEAMQRSRLHPMAILLASRTYASGHGLRGSLTWKPVQRVVDALDEAFVLAFKNVEPTGKRYLLALDVSGSMDGGSVAGTNLTPREGAAAMALVTARTEEQYEIVGFTRRGEGEWTHTKGRSSCPDGVSPVPFTARSTLNSVCEATRAMPMGGTDCALPMIYALEKKTPVDVFVVYTDSETYAGHVHPSVALKEYRQRMGIAAKLIVVGLVSNEFTIADPNDAGMFDVVGFDASAPAVMADFARR